LFLLEHAFQINPGLLETALEPEPEPEVLEPATPEPQSTNNVSEVAPGTKAITNQQPEKKSQVTAATETM
jgi:hypothetical protein